MFIVLIVADAAAVVCLEFWNIQVGSCVCVCVGQIKFCLRKWFLSGWNGALLLLQVGSCILSSEQSYILLVGLILSVQTGLVVTGNVPM